MSAASGSLHVLHVDDEPDFAEMAADFIRREDARFDIETATSADTALDQLRENNVDCVVSDFEMPGKNGIEFLRTIREEHPDLPFILFTGKGSEEVASDAISAGVTDYLQKDSGTNQYEVLANRIVNAVEANRAQRERSRQLNAIETVQEGISILDEAGEFIFVNQAYADLYGYEPDAFIGKHWDMIYQDEDIQHIQDEVLPEVREVGHWHGTTTGLRADGTTFVEDHVLALTERGELVCTVRDITARQERVEDLERTRDLLDHTERIADVGGWEIDTDTMEVFWTDHLFEILGIESDEEPPLDEALDVYHEEDRPIVERAVETALDSGESFDIEVRFQRPDGELRWLRARGTPTIENGEVVTLRGAVHDITDRLRRERVLRDMHGIISDRDRSFEEQVEDLLRLGRTELNTSYGTLSRINGDEYLFEVVDADDDSIKAGDVVPVAATNCEIAASTEQTLVLGDVERDAPEQTDRAGFTDWGISCYVGAPVFAHDKVYGTFCFYETEARAGQFSEWEVTLVDLMSKWVSYELEHREANERLRDKNLQLEQFTSIISHDLRNPLNVAEGRIALAMEECDSNHLDTVEMAHDRMGALIDDLLTLARQGRAVEDTEQISLSDIAELCWGVVDLGEAELHIETTKEFTADAGRLKQLLENLFRNAIDHGGDDVTITVGNLDDGFYVADNGAGIPAANRSEVFEEGYSTNYKGTGFGLPIVKQITDAHGWSVGVTQAESGGARFEITGVEFE